MLDFVFSNSPSDLQKMQASMSGVYEDFGVALESYSGSWGALVVQKSSLAESRVKTLETNECILTMVGLPVYIGDTKLNEESCAAYLLDKCNEAKTFDVSSILSGGFLILCINKAQNYAKVFTDLLSMIPAYCFKGESRLVIGSHVDIVADISEKRASYDLASITEFTLNAKVTYPYSCYREINQLAPASEILLDFKDPLNIKVLQHFYWKPSYQNQTGNIDQVAEELNFHLHDFCRNVLSYGGDNALMMSGGEDSRLLLTILSRYSEIDSFVFLDSCNQEGALAKAACKALSSDLKVLIRNKSYYLDIHKYASKLVGLGHQYMHVHAIKFLKDLAGGKYQRVFGGYLSDALLKGSRAAKYDLQRFGLYFDFPRSRRAASDDLSFGLPVKYSLLEEINYRRRLFDQSDLFSELSPDTDWKGFFPMSTYKSAPHYFGHRRLLAQYEPFTASAVIKLAAKTPLSWKRNRRLFQRVAKMNMVKTKFIGHTDGHLPFYPWYYNLLAVPSVRLGRTFKEIVIGGAKKTQGPWNDWRETNSDPELSRYESEYNRSIYEQIFVGNLQEVFGSKHFAKSNRSSVLQVLYQTSVK